MDYLKLFGTDAEYQAFKQSDKFIKPNVSHCVSENEVHYNPHTFADEYLTFVALENTTFTFTPRNNNVVSYSIDNGNSWTQGNTVEVNAGDKVLWKGEMTPIFDDDYEIYGVGAFNSTGRFDVYGNVMSLLYGDNFKGQTGLTGKDGAFANLFSYDEVECKLVNAKNLSLPAITLAQKCYLDMFSKCVYLVTAPELPATILASNCYTYMFGGCTSLTTAPELPATTLAGRCYQSMFAGCTSLTTAPELPATTLANNCYFSMFYNCASLTKAPELPAETLVESCYEEMFFNCTSLVNVPDLAATTLAQYCCLRMFYNCTSLVNAPVLPATTLAQACYNYMFGNCSNLKYIKCLATSNPDYAQNWVNGVAASGTFIKAASMSGWTTGVNGIPDGWTVQDA